MKYDPPRCVCGCPKNNHAMNMSTYQCVGRCTMRGCDCQKFQQEG